MQATNAAIDRRTDRSNYQTADQTRHSREDAIEAKIFEHLVEATYGLDQYYAVQCRFILFMCGRLGMRAGELAHMSDDWIDWRRSMICIPRHDPCAKGRDGGICGHCRQNAAQKARIETRNRYATVHTQLSDRDELEPGGGAAQNAVVPETTLYQRGWTAKTDAAAREIPFDSVVRAAIALERFFDHYDEWPVSQSAINRRVKRMADAATGIEPDEIYPHALRATSATFWAYHGLNAHSLKGLMGWAQLSTARAYIADSGQRTAQAMRDATI